MSDPICMQLNHAEAMDEEPKPEAALPVYSFTYDQNVAPEHEHLFHLGDDLTTVSEFSAVRYDQNTTVKLASGTRAMQRDKPYKVISVPSPGRLANGKDVIVMCHMTKYLMNRAGTEANVVGQYVQVVNAPVKKGLKEEDLYVVPAKDVTLYKNPDDIDAHDAKNIDFMLPNTKKFGQSSHRLTSLSHIKAYKSGKAPGFMLKACIAIA